MIFDCTSSVKLIISSLSFSISFSLLLGRSRIVSGTSTSASPMNSSYLPTCVLRSYGKMSPVMTLSYSCVTGIIGALASVLSFQSVLLASRPSRPCVPCVSTYYSSRKMKRLGTIFEGFNIAYCWRRSCCCYPSDSSLLFCFNIIFYFVNTSSSIIFAYFWRADYVSLRHKENKIIHNW